MLKNLFWHTKGKMSHVKSPERKALLPFLNQLTKSIKSINSIESKNKTKNK